MTIVAAIAATSFMASVASARVSDLAACQAEVDNAVKAAGGRRWTAAFSIRAAVEP